MSKRILVFPAGMPRAIEFMERANADGQKVIGASSLHHDPSRALYPDWAYLPFVTSSEFLDSLKSVITENNIGGIYTPNPVVWDHLKRQLPETFPGVTLINSSPIDEETKPHKKALDFGEHVSKHPIELASGIPSKLPVSPIEISSLFLHANTIPGMCDQEKIHALCEIFRHSTEGDIVEIGSWWGKSAFVLAQLSKYYKVGNLLCVDPWANENLIQNDEKGLVDQVDVNAEEALTVFQLNLLPYANGAVNYLRYPSVDAAERFKKGGNITTPVFGETEYKREIAILHIDGNHSYENANADLQSWKDLVVSGGWIIIDDYIWPYGDGPKLVGDEFVKQQKDNIACAFVMGSALFVQLK